MRMSASWFGSWTHRIQGRGAIVIRARKAGDDRLTGDAEDQNARVGQSIDLIRRAIDKMPESEIAVKVTGNPNGEYMARTEQPRGEVVYHVQANGTKNLQRFRVRTPTFANLPAMVKTLQGCDLADVPVLVLTIDPCISCTER